MTGQHFDIKRFAVHDGPGLRTTAFLKGCPLDCVWCHNPEGKRLGPEICHLPSSCIGCGRCVGVCPHGAIVAGNEGIAVNRHRCVRCGMCAGACPSGSLIRKGWEITAHALVDEFCKDRVFYETSGGGITLSGGDPLFQPEFAMEILAGAKERGLHTAVETCLHAAQLVIQNLLPLVDLWLVDLKLMEDDRHKRLAGCSNRLILENYSYLVEQKAAMLTRIPVIPGCTDAEENLTALGEYITKTNPAGEVELMFYNPLAESKYRNYGTEFSLPDAQPYSGVRKAALRQLVAGTGVAKVL